MLKLIIMILSALVINLILFNLTFASSQIIISEIMYDPQGPDEGFEWLEIYNPSPIKINLQSIYFNDGFNHLINPTSKNGSRSDLILYPGEYTILADDALKFKQVYPLVNCDVLDTTMTLANNYKTIRLKDKNNHFYADSGYWWTLGAADNGYSLIKKDNSFKQGFVKGGQPCSDNTQIKPVIQNSQIIQISEISPYPEQGREEFIELYNPHNHEVDISFWQLDDQMEGIKPYIFPKSSKIKPKSFLVIYQHQSKLTLSNNFNLVELKDNNDNIIDLSPIYINLKKGFSLNRLGEIWVKRKPSPNEGFGNEYIIPLSAFRKKV